MAPTTLSPVDRVLRRLAGISETDDDRTVLTRLEFASEGDAGHRVCPVCKGRPAQDSANPREWEGHLPDCLIATSLAGL